MVALFNRERTGVGQEVDVSLFQTGIYQLSTDIAGALVTGLDCDDWRVRSRADAPNALVQAYKTKDNRWLLLSVVQPERYWSPFCQAIERKDLEHDPRFLARISAARGNLEKGKGVRIEDLSE
jgi:formyl-CoA transferase